MQSHAELLGKKIENRTAQVSIIGLGYVGLPLAVEVAKAGFKVYGVEKNAHRCSLVNEGRNYIKDVRDTEFNELVKKGMIRAETDFSPLATADIIIICVPTPLNKNKEPDISYIVSSTEGIAQHFRKGTLIVLESTTYPGTTEEIIQTRIEKMGNKVGQDFFLAFSPERIDPGNKTYGTANTTKIVGGVSPECLKISEAFYKHFIKKMVMVSSPRVAEMAKVFENTYRSVNIALVNELAQLAERMGIDVYEVIAAADTKPYGFQAFWPGPGVGGHCIPLDPYYLAWKGKEYDMHARFIELAGEINENQPRVVVAKAAEILNNYSKALRGSKIVQLGVAYKKDIDDPRESPSVRIYELLVKAGAEVAVCDSFVKEFYMHENDPTYGNNGPVEKSVPLSAELLRGADLVMITTDHTDFDYKLVAQHSKVVFDTRNAMGFRQIQGSNIVKLSTRVEQGQAAHGR